MILRLLTLPFRVAGFVVSLAFTMLVVEGLGVYAYLQWRHARAFDALVADGLTVPEVWEFLWGHPDVFAVVVVLAVVSVWLALTSGGGSNDGHGGGWSDDDGGGFGGFGGGGGDGGDGGE